ncbi:cytochrome P450 2J5 [Nephila pilipes]|uniref:Cytochrome P450 2J5 n=1 Tax=Nephila pilipes TaxID=299642 RepID=A0A8X6NGI1_NEPPI|nr:cytochrome P450 2J5 [Nephila pilipes]
MMYLDLTVTNILLTLTLTLVFLYAYKWIRNRNYPPGPIGLPIIGYYPFLGKKPNLTLRDLSNKYGDIFSLYIGPQLMIIISDHELAKEILNHPMAMARPPHSLDFLVGKGGFIGMNGEEWQEQRRFVLHTMRNLGMGKGLWETIIQEDAAEFVKELKKAAGEPVSFSEPLANSQITNSVSLLFGRHLDHETEKEDIEIIKEFRRQMAGQGSSVDVNMNIPGLMSLLMFFNVFGIRDFITQLRKFENIFKKEVEKRIEKKDEITRDDFIGCFLQEIEKRAKDTQPHTFTIDTLRGNLLILFLTGQDSNVASVTWLLLLMAKYPDVQEKVCDEIDRVIGRDGTVYYGDKLKLPYSMATVQEMLRYIAIAPLFPPRYVLESLSFGGYTIPRGSHVICNNWAISHDQRYFEDPITFKPERFLSEDKSKVEKLKGYGPFSFGKRNCPGEGVAMMTIYLFFVSIMQKFKIQGPHGLPPNMDYTFGSGLYPIEQKLCFIER